MGIVPVLCIVPKCLFPSLYPEAIVTSFLYSVSYREHGGTIVAVFLFGGLSVSQDRGRHKAVVCLIIAFLSSNSTFPRAACCRHSPELLSRPPVAVAGSSFPKVKFWHCHVAPFCGYRYLQICLKV